MVFLILVLREAEASIFARVGQQSMHGITPTEAAAQAAIAVAAIAVAALVVSAVSVNSCRIGHSSFACVVIITGRVQLLLFSLHNTQPLFIS